MVSWVISPTFSSIVIFFSSASTRLSTLPPVGAGCCAFPAVASVSSAAPKTPNVHRSFISVWSLGEQEGLGLGGDILRLRAASFKRVAALWIGCECPFQSARREFPVIAVQRLPVA